MRYELLFCMMHYYVLFNGSRRTNDAKMFVNFTITNIRMNFRNVAHSSVFQMLFVNYILPNGDFQFLSFFVWTLSFHKRLVYLKLLKLLLEMIVPAVFLQSLQNTVRR